MLTIYTSNSAKNLTHLFGKNYIFWPEIKATRLEGYVVSLHPIEIEKVCEDILHEYSHCQTNPEDDVNRNMTLRQ